MLYFAACSWGRNSHAREWYSAGGVFSLRDARAFRHICVCANSNKHRLSNFCCSWYVNLVLWKCWIVISILISGKAFDFQIQIFKSYSFTIACFSALLRSLSSDGYQIVVGGSQSKLMSDMSVANIQVSFSLLHLALCVKREELLMYREKQ